MNNIRILQILFVSFNSKLIFTPTLLSQSYTPRSMPLQPTFCQHYEALVLCLLHSMVINLNASKWTIADAPLHSAEAAPLSEEWKTRAHHNRPTHKNGWSHPSASVTQQSETRNLEKTVGCQASSSPSWCHWSCHVRRRSYGQQAPSTLRFHPSESTSSILSPNSPSVIINNSQNLARLLTQFHAIPGSLPILGEQA